MVADTQIMEKAVVLAQQLSPEYRLRLIQRITETLLPQTSSQKQGQLQFGKYRSGKMSTWEDFALAEWHPSDTELNGD